MIEGVIVATTSIDIIENTLLTALTEHLSSEVRENLGNIE